LKRIRHLRSGDWAILVAAAALLIAGAARYAHQPSFWLDEAFIAVSLRNPSIQTIFASLKYGQYFPRVYLLSIAFLREAFGYEIWVLRLFPFLSFVIATLFWARLLARRAGGVLVVGLLAGGLLLEAGFWLDQSIQLKQYTFDVMLALIPFLLSDRFFDETLTEGKRKTALVLLAAPLLLSYTYPLVLGARVLGWYLDRVRKRHWHLSVPGLLLFVVLIPVGLAVIWAIDLRFNLNRAVYIRYWESCILGVQHSPSENGRLLADFLWGWHSNRLLIIAFVVPLQLLGVFQILRSRVSRGLAENDVSWGSRSLGSLCLLGGVILASALFYLPICAGRLVLFTQIHVQLLAIEGALWILIRAKQRRAALAAILLCGCIAIAYGGRSYWRFVSTEPNENLRPLLPLIARDRADIVWVHPCSVAQVKSLPQPLPVERVILGSETEMPESGQRVWVLWSHMGLDTCVQQMDRLRSQARSWEDVYRGPESGLALAQF
jgi:hypothetical protein